MAISEALHAGLQLMAIGMGVVFLLLGLLVVTIQGVSRLVRLLETPPAQPPVPAAVATTPAPVGAELAAVIGAAVRSFRARRS